MNGILTLLTLLTISTAQHISNCQQSPLNSPTKVNVENTKLIITGNQLGEIGVCKDSGTNTTTTRIITYHRAPIIYIERYMLNTTWGYATVDGVIEYVVVDQSGTVSIWDRDFTGLLETIALNVTVIGAAIKEQTQNIRNVSLAINCKTFIIELSLTQRKVIRRLDDNATYLALFYSQNLLFASCIKDTKAKLIYYNQSGLTEINQAFAGDTINFLTKSNVYSTTITGLSSFNRLVQISQKGIIEMSLPIDAVGRGSRQLRANYLRFCGSIFQNGRMRRQNRLFVIGFNDTIALRTFQEKGRWIVVGKEIADISCTNQHLYVLTKGGKLELYQLWQLYLSSELYMAGVELSLLVLVFAFVGYKVAKRWAKKKEMTEACVQTQQAGKEIQLKEFLLRENN